MKTRKKAEHHKPPVPRFTPREAEAIYDTIWRVSWQTDDFLVERQSVLLKILKWREEYGAFVRKNSR